MDKLHKIETEDMENIQDKNKNKSDNYTNASDWLNKMSNIKYPWYEKIYYFFYRIIDKTKDIYYEIKYGFQRMFRGYDDVETFETFSTFLKRYTKILKKFRKSVDKYPQEFDTYEDWTKVLDEMINHFELSDEFHSSYKDIEFYEAEQKAQDHTEKALEMFVKYFWNLWN